MYNLEEEVMGRCCHCGRSIPISESICVYCLDDMAKQSDYEDYLDIVAHDHE